MRGIVFVCSFFARPSQKEIFERMDDHNDFDNSTAYRWSESLDCYFGNQFWEEYSDILDNRSVYKIILKISIFPMNYFGYYGYEYDEQVHTEMICCTKASSFSELRSGLHDAGIITMSPEKIEFREQYKEKAAFAARSITIPNLLSHISKI